MHSPRSPLFFIGVHFLLHSAKSSLATPLPLQTPPFGAPLSGLTGSGALESGLAGLRTRVSGLGLGGAIITLLTPAPESFLAGRLVPLSRRFLPLR